MILLYIFLALIIVLCTWLFLISPGDSQRMEKFKGIRYAHRGLHGKVGGYDTEAAENSLTAFERAKEHGFGIELDVRLSKDGELVVFHDGTLERVCGKEERVEDLTVEELRAVSLQGTDDYVPTLCEVLELIDGSVPLIIELKEEGMDHSISQKTAKVMKEYKGDFVVESFSPFAFGSFKKELPDIPRGFLAHKHTLSKEKRALRYRLIQRFVFNFLSRPAFIAINAKTPKLFPLPIISAIYKTTIVAWTVRSRDEEIQAYKNGADAVIFEGYMPDGQ